ncbi:hypothetical protein [Nocardioides sp. 616]|uniref:DUF6912 family protein n=1 Tax=Nocardioides sp. 616 TaxID=2268090 RepID=UPI000CE4CD19|nr:hypothetical protein [Nocardioides sp. 616]
MSTRVYLPADWQGVVERVEVHRMVQAMGDAPSYAEHTGYAVTPALRAALPDCDDEELEHVAMTQAAQESLHHFVTDDGPRRRLVLVVEATEVEQVDDVAQVRAEVSIPGDVVAWLVDTEEAGEDVSAAVAALDRGDLEAFEEAAERCLDHELAWFAATEVDEVMGLR